MAALRRPRNAMRAFVRDALIQSRLMKAFQMRPAYQRNDYLGWIDRAVRGETRRRRLTQMLQELAAGDRYMNMAFAPRSRSKQGRSGDV